MVAENLGIGTGKAAYIETGVWAKKAAAEAKKLGLDVDVIASSKDRGYSYIPDVKKMVEEKLPSAKAYSVKADGTINEFEFSTGDLTGDERKIILAGCLINFYRN